MPPGTSGAPSIPRPRGKARTRPSDTTPGPRVQGAALAKVKGTNLISAVKLMRRNRAQALAALPPTLHHYLDERVLPTSLYPEAEPMTLARRVTTLWQTQPDTGRLVLVQGGAAAPATS
jgi:hypothetical protein